MVYYMAMLISSGATVPQDIPFNKPAAHTEVCPVKTTLVLFVL